MGSLLSPSMPSFLSPSAPPSFPKSPPPPVHRRVPNVRHHRPVFRKLLRSGFAFRAEQPRPPGFVIGNEKGQSSCVGECAQTVGESTTRRREYANSQRTQHVPLSTQSLVVFPTLYGPVGFGIGNTGANTPAAVDRREPKTPKTETNRHTAVGILIPGSLPSALTEVQLTVARYAGTTCHRVPSNRACSPRMIRKGAPDLMRLVLVFRTDDLVDVPAPAPMSRVLRAGIAYGYRKRVRWKQHMGGQRV